MKEAEDFAAMIDGRECRKEISLSEEMQARELGLVVIYADDWFIFCGATEEIRDADDGAMAWLTPQGLLPAWSSLGDDEAAAERYFQQKAKAKSVRLKEDSGGYSWVIETDIPHAAFDVMARGGKYCRGVVIRLDDIGGTK